MDFKINISFVLATIFISLFLIIGIIELTEIKTAADKRKRKRHFLIGLTTLLTGVILGLSLMISLSKGEHIDVKITSYEYPIEKVTTKMIHFDNKAEPVNRGYIKIETSDDEHKNVVIKEIKDYNVKWLIWKIKRTNINYRAYLAEEIYSKLEMEKVLYENNDA